MTASCSDARDLRLVMVEQEPQLPPAPTLQESLLLRARTHAAWGDGALADEREQWRLESRLEEFLHRFGLTGTTAPARLLGRGAQARRAGPRAGAAAGPAAAR